MRNLLYYIFFWIGIIGCSSSEMEEIPEIIPDTSTHPFLIVKEGDFPALRQKAASEPWKSMKEDAISRSNAGINGSGGSSNPAYRLQFYTGAAALAFILDEANAETHANRVRDAILNHYSKLDVVDGGDWGGVVPPMGSFFVAILALDIVYDALSAADIQSCEAVILNQINKIGRTGSWADVRRGTHGTWDIYKRDRTEPDDDYYQGIMVQITEDGVSPVTIHYAWERVGGGDSRLSKSGYMDVLEFTGIDQRYYGNERLQKFQRWLFGSSVNNSKEMAIIGDMLPNQGLNRYLLHERVVNFDQEAGAYAAWFLQGKKPKGHILTYIVPKSTLPPPQYPKSMLYENGGAFFRENAEDQNGIHAVLYNISSQDEWHTHQETNGLALSALGNRLLVNGGRLGAPTRPAPLNNTLTINGEEHASRLGDGITEGFTSPGLDYAKGSSGRAIPKGQHWRSLILVHGSDEMDGYCLVFDEIVGSGAENVKTFFHPANQTQIEEMKPDIVFDAKIDHQAANAGSKLAFYFVTPAQEILIEKVPSAVPERYPGYPDHNRLEAVYDMVDKDSKGIITLLYPHHHNTPIPTFVKIENPLYAGGVLVNEKGTSDFFLTPEADTLLLYDRIHFRAKGLFYRELDGAVSYYFVQEGTRFSNQNTGFDADDPVSIYYNRNSGAIISPGTQIVMYAPGIQNVQFDPPASITKVGQDSIQVLLPEGTFRFQ